MRPQQRDDPASAAVVRHGGPLGALFAALYLGFSAAATSGALPLDFFHVPLPQGFATRDPLSFDIRTLNGYKLYRIRQTYDTNFGTLTGVFPAQNPRYIQFGIKIIF